LQSTRQITQIIPKKLITSNLYLIYITPFVDIRSLRY